MSSKQQEPDVPPAVLKLKPSRRMILVEYFKIRDNKDIDVYRYIAQKLNYDIDENNTNQFVRRVIRDFLSH